MILYEGGSDIPVRKVNSSRAYANGKKFMTNNCGEITIIGQIDRFYEAVRNGKVYRNYCYFIVEFEDGTKVECSYPKILSGETKNPNHPMVFSRGVCRTGTMVSIY